jgi:hypothetical protein
MPLQTEPEAFLGQTPLQSANAKPSLHLQSPVPILPLLQTPLPEHIWAALVALVPGQSPAQLLPKFVGDVHKSQRLEMLELDEAYWQAGPHRVALQ